MARIQLDWDELYPWLIITETMEKPSPGYAPIHTIPFEMLDRYNRAVTELTNASRAILEFTKENPPGGGEYTL